MHRLEHARTDLSVTLAAGDVSYVCFYVPETTGPPGLKKETRGRCGTQTQSVHTNDPLQCPRFTTPLLAPGPRQTRGLDSIHYSQLCEYMSEVLRVLGYINDLLCVSEQGAIVQGRVEEDRRLHQKAFIKAPIS